VDGRPNDGIRHDGNRAGANRELLVDREEEREDGNQKNAAT
jgi:hypothetical protein